MKKLISKILLAIICISLFPLQNFVNALDEVTVSENRIKNVRDPIDETDAANKKYVDNKIEGIEKPPAVLQTEGQSETAVMSQKATTNMINNTKEDIDNIIADVNKKIEELQGKQVTISSGTWEPVAISDGTNPTYTTEYRYGKYYRINNLVYITFHMKINITNWGSGYAQIGGLPFTAAGNMNNQGLALREFIVNTTAVNNPCGSVIDSTKKICLYKDSGESGQQWRNGDCWIGFSGCYITNESVNDLSNVSVNQNIFDAIYPVGSIYMSVNAVNPSVLFGGTWQSWAAGRVPVGVDTSNSNFNSVEKTGGSANHRHTWRIGLHWFYGDTCGEGEGSGTGAYVYSESRYDGWGRDLASKSVVVNNNSTTSTKVVTANGKYSQGDTATGSSLQPYITCYMWKRTA